jgi:hypothetical protein
MVFATVYRSVFSRLLAALIVVLVLSPYTEPFATIVNGDVGAIDLGAESKLKTSTLEALIPVPAVVPADGTSPAPVGMIVPAVSIDVRSSQRTILRL